MTYAPYPSTTPGKLFEVIAVTDDTITIRHPDDGRTKTIPRPVDYNPLKGRVAVAAAAKAKPGRTLEYTWSNTICAGAWTVKRYSDGTRTASLTERWDTPLPDEKLVTDAQREAQLEYEESLVGASRRKV